MGSVTMPKAKETRKTGESCNPGGGKGPREGPEPLSETGCQNGVGGREQPSLSMLPVHLRREPPIGQTEKGGQEVQLGGWSPGAERAETLRDRTLIGGKGWNQEEPAFPPSSLALPPNNLFPWARPSLS